LLSLAFERRGLSGGNNIAMMAIKDTVHKIRWNGRLVMKKTNGNKGKKMYGLALAMLLSGATLSVPMHVEAAEKFDPAF